MEELRESLLNRESDDLLIKQNLESLYANESLSDDPSVYDFRYQEFESWGAITDGFQFPANKLVIYDQSEDPRTRTACSIYSPRLANNWQNIVEYEQLELPEYEQKDPKKDRLDYRKNWNLYTWGTIQNALTYLAKVDSISWWAVCQTVSEIDDALANGKLVCTGSQFWDWETIFRTKKYSESNRLQWHIFCLVSKYRDYYVALHGYKACPYFLVHRDQLPRLFSKNALLDKDDSDKIAWMKARVKAMKLAPLNSEFWNATDNMKIRDLLAKVTKEMRDYYKFSK